MIKLMMSNIVVTCLGLAIPTLGTGMGPIKLMGRNSAIPPSLSIFFHLFSQRFYLFWFTSSQGVWPGQSRNHTHSAHIFVLYLPTINNL